MKKVIVAAAIVLMIGGLVGLGITYQELKLQRHLHDKLAGVRLELAQASAQTAERFTTLNEGMYTLHLSTLISSSPERRTSSTFAGMVEYSITDSGGRLRYLSRVLPGNTPAVVADSATIITLDTIYIPEAGAPMQLHARVMTPDSTFAHTVSEIFLMPPADPGFDDYVRRQAVVMALAGLVMLAGFCVLVFGGRARRLP